MTNALKSPSVYSLQSEQSGVVTALNKLLFDLNFSQNSLARKIGISSSVLSQILAGSYLYDKSNSVWIQIEKFIEKVTGEIFETELLRKVHRVLNQTFKEKKIAVITSCSGAGKTTAIERYCLINQEAVIIRVTEVFNVKFMLQKMMQSIDAEYEGLSKQQMYESLSEMLQRKQRLFVIDEAERLHVSELETLRDLFDQGNIGPCLIGLSTLRKILQTGHTRKMDLVQLYSRVSYTEVVNILSAKDVRLVFGKITPKNKVSDKMCSKLSYEFASKGGLRAIINIAEYAARLSDKVQADVDDDMIPDVIQKVTL